jgi:hypothetical protein
VQIKPGYPEIPDHNQYDGTDHIDDFCLVILNKLLGPGKSSFNILKIVILLSLLACHCSIFRFCAAKLVFFSKPSVPVVGNLQYSCILKSDQVG